MLGFLKRRADARVLSFVALATALATANTYGSTLAAALFLNRAGANAIPLYYILYAMLSIPVSMAFSQVIDRWPRPVLFMVLLAAGAVILALAAPLARGQSVALFYALYTIVSVFEQLSYSVFYVLVSDYFTSVETNRSTTALALGMALGGLLGGALAGAGAEGFNAADLLFGMPALLAGTAFLFSRIRRRTAPLGEAEPQAEEGLWASLSAFRPLIARCPIVGLLALGVFVNIVVQSLIEYQVFVVYTDHFPDERALTRFLGVLNGVLNLVNIATSILVTGPLLTRVGVARMNLVYPAMTVSAFAAFGVSFALPSAIFGHIVYDPWAHSVDAPVFVSNYNAVPHRFVGRVRIFNDGLMYPLAMAAGGAGLWVLAGHVSQRIVTLVGLGFALAFLACGLIIRRAYARGLMEMLRAGSLDLDVAGTAVSVISTDHHGDIRRLLNSGDEHSQSLGIELAARSDARVFQHELESLVARAAGPVRSLFIRRFGARLTAELKATLIALLDAEEASVRAAAMEALMASNEHLDAGMLSDLVRDPATGVAGLAAIETSRRGLDIPAAESAITRLLDGDERIRLRAIQAIRRCSDPQFLPVLAQLRATSSVSVVTGVLEAAAEMGSAASAAVWAAEALQNTAPGEGAIRRAAYKLLAAQENAADVPLLAAGLDDPLKEVRFAAAAGLARFGETALPVVNDALSSGNDLREDAAIEAAGRIGGSAVDALLYRHLTARHFSAVWRNERWLASLPAAAAHRPDPWSPLAVALANSNRRALDTALAVLGALGYRRTLQAMRGILAGGSERSRANAVETIASIGHRRFVQPLLPMLEAGMDAVAVRRGAGTEANRLQLLAEAVADADRWVRAGAILSGQVAALPDDDPDPIVQDAIAHIRTPNPKREPIMNRLIFLKSVPLFSGLSLDDLLSVDAAMGREDYLAGEAIVREGEGGSTLFILANGQASVCIGAENREVAKLGPGDFFGEMSLFDDQPRSASVVATTDAALLTLERDRFSTLVLQRPEVLLHICRMFGNRLRETNRKLLAAA